MKQVITLDPPYRWATPQDAEAMARFVNMAGHGLPLYIWQQMADEAGDATAWEIGAQRAQRESGAFSYRNTVIRDVDGVASAVLIGYGLPEEPDPARFDELPAMFVALQELEDLVPGTWYINVLATAESMRGKGLGQGLLAVAEDLARAGGCTGLSLIVMDSNTGARRLYQRNGYDEVAQKPMIKENWQSDGVNWVLLHKPF